MEKGMTYLHIDDGEDNAWFLSIIRWRIDGTLLGVQNTDLGEKHNMFKFYYELDVERVVNGAPWTLNNYFLVIHFLQENDDPMQICNTPNPFLLPE
ncbi:hypothetical protein Goklo_020091 [Gossypium klotzschianum]|uniref:DUF4283 domain-containing protein n=1 Tax=Gossypium klotzschianum TaxID=34286 RepID=A0A7J8UQT0_9ROSI|nr:hypothetical protein [Gossypium klotzschianum]